MTLEDVIEKREKEEVLHNDIASSYEIQLTSTASKYALTEAEVMTLQHQVNQSQSELNRVNVTSKERAKRLSSTEDQVSCLQPTSEEQGIEMSIYDNDTPRNKNECENMGMKIPADVFQKESSMIFQEIPYILIYIDDILITTKTNYG